MMPTTNLRKHVTPLGSEVSLTREVIYTQFGESIHDVIPVANVTARGQLVTDMVAKGKGPSAANPLVVYRADAPGLHRIESTTDGVAWVPSSSLPHFPDVAAATSFATANPGLLTVGDRCVAGSTTYVWSGSAWQNGGMAVAGITAPLVGSGSVDSRLLVQFGSRAGVANASSNLSLVFPQPFPNGVVMVMATPGDALSSARQMSPSALTVAGCDMQCLNATGAGVGAVAVRYNWIAIGF